MNTTPAIFRRLGYRWPPRSYVSTAHPGHELWINDVSVKSTAPTTQDEVVIVRWPGEDSTA